MSPGRHTPEGPTLRARLGRATGLAAVMTQVWQAGTSFVLQILAAHLLGAEGIGVIALCLGAIVVGTSVTSGFVGDSLTVLDRHRRHTRAGLEAWAVIVMVVTSVLVTALLWAGAVLDAATVGIFALAALVFQIEELLRRVLMANQRFWMLLLVDTTALAGSLAVILAAAVWGGGVSVRTFLLAVVVGQGLACITAAALIPDPTAPWCRCVVRTSGEWRPSACGAGPR